MSPSKYNVLTFSVIIHLHPVSLVSTEHNTILIFETWPHNLFTWCEKHLPCKRRLIYTYKEMSELVSNTRAQEKKYKENESLQLVNIN